MMKRIQSLEVFMLVLYAVVWSFLLWLTAAQNLVGMSPGALGGDAIQYDALARSLVTHGVYALDGVTPFFEREPGYSLFLALVYSVTGIGNVVAVYVVQGILHASAAFFLVRTLRSFLSHRASSLVFAFLLFFPAVFHIIFSLTRESVALSFVMLFIACAFRLKQTGSMKWALLSGLTLGYVFLTYAVFLLFPLVFIGILFVWRVPLRSIVLSILACAVVMSGWGIRNMHHTDMMCMTGCYRAALQWYVRGEQAQHIGIGGEPLRCLWSEYVSRDYTGRSSYCNFNAVWHEKWPEGFIGVPADAVIIQEGQQHILQHFPSYLWFSLFEVLELHFPYVNGWGWAYNLSAGLTSLILYIGCVCAIPALKRKEHLLLGLLVLYITGLFALTDAIPRYLMPIICCYAIWAAIGYDRLLHRIWRH